MQSKEYYKEYYKKNKEKYKAKHAEYYEKNRDGILERTKLNQKKKYINKTPKDRPGYIYLIKLDIPEVTYYKIGYTTNPTNRFKGLTTWMPDNYEVLVMAFVEDCILLETQLLYYFRKRNTRNEWFRLTEADVQEFKEIVMGLRNFENV